MKRSIVFGLAVIFCLLAHSALAEEYTVKAGDCLSKIGQQSGAPWREIAKANKIRPPKYIVMIGQKLTIPRPVAVAAETKVDDSARIARIKALEAQIVELERQLNQVAAAARKEAQPSAAIERKEAAPAGGDTQTGVEVGEKAVVKEEKTTAEVKPPVIPDVVPKTKTKSYAEDDRFSAYMSIGSWQSSGAKDESRGWYGQAKIRYRPFIFNAFGHEVGAGGFLMGEAGEGETDKWDFRWGKIAFGPTFKIYGNRWDASTDLGWARQWDFGVNDKQFTDSGYFLQYVNFEQRRGAGKKWLPQTELLFAATVPYSASRESTKDGKTFGQSLPANDKTVYGLEVRQSIYDFNFDNHMRLTPGLLLGGGFEAGNSYGKIGPFVRLAAYGQNILTADLSVKDKSSVDGVRWYAALMLNVDGAVKAIKASRITPPTAADLASPAK